MQKRTPKKSRHLMIFTYTNYFRIIYRGLILALTKYPSLIVAVFLRKNFGERYFTLSACIIFGIILAVPYFAAQELSDYTDIVDSLNFTWMLFIAVFIGFSIKRRLEFKRSSKTIRTDRFSYFEGEINTKLWDWVEDKTRILKADNLYIARFYEPLLVFLVGIALMLLYVTRFVGLFVVIISILQYLRVSVQLAMGRDFLMDEIDEIIAKENLRNTLVFDKPASETQGYSIFAPRPESMEIREKIVDQIFAREQTEETVTL